jgi:hypothetical protein
MTADRNDQNSTRQPKTQNGDHLKRVRDSKHRRRMPYPHQVPARVAKRLCGIAHSLLHRNVTDPNSIDLYDRLIFKVPNAWYNARAPPFWLSWLFAVMFTVAACFQYSRRVQQYRTHILDTNWSIRSRTLISAYIDTDDPWFVINKFTAQSLWFLGGMQLDYASAFTLMMAVFAVESILDSLRVVIAYVEAPSLKDYIPTSDYYITPKNPKTLQLQPSNVYEDLSRPFMIVVMVFVTQVLLISMVFVDISQTSTYICHDGTTGCPVVGTLGSYVFYLLGVFLALVFLLGPKTNYGSSEQNTSFWLQMLLTAKQTGACASWNDPLHQKLKHYNLVNNDWRLWLRFVMSFVVNGIGFHVLIHALPIQVGSQGSFTQVVLRSVGMMYLVDLDDIAGCKVVLTEGDKPEHVDFSGGATSMDDEAQAIRKIINDATERLDALSASKKKQ